MAPASLLNAHLQGATNGRAHLTETQGTIWAGRGRFELRDAQNQSSIGKPIAWTLMPASLLGGRLVFDIRIEQSAAGFPLAISASRIDITNASVELPGAVLGLAMPKLAPLGLSGQVMLKVETLSIGRDELLGNFTVRWQAAGSALAPVSPFGDYTLHVTGDETGMRAAVQTLEGPLHIAGSGPVSPGGSFSFPVVLTVSDNYFAQFAPLLRMISIERGDHSFEFKFT